MTIHRKIETITTATTSAIPSSAAVELPYIPRVNLHFSIEK